MILLLSFQNQQQPKSHKNARKNRTAAPTSSPPTHKRMNSMTPGGTGTTTLIHAQFMLSPKSVTTSGAEKLIEILSLSCPEILPTRCGIHEQAMQRIGPSYESFFDLWGKGLVAEGFFSIIAYTTQPFYSDILISFADLRSAPFQTSTPSETPVHLVEITAESTKLEQDLTLADKAVRIFKEIAVEFDAFFAAAYLQPALIDNKIRYVPPGSLDLHSSKSWLGIPDEPTWLAWYGKPYAPLVESTLTASNITLDTSENGIMIRLCDLPVPKNQLLARFPKLPDELLRRPNPDWAFRDGELSQGQAREIFGGGNLNRLQRYIPAPSIPVQ
jgi:hypothetical protein